MRGRSLPLVAFLFFSLAGACGGATDQYDLLGGGGPVNTAPKDAGSDAPSQGGGLTDVSVPQDTGAPFVDTGTPVVDTGTPVPESSPIDTGGGGADFLCPPTTCHTPEVCCATGTGQGNTPTFKCQGPSDKCGTTSAPGTPISCATSADCPGEVCCGADLNGFYEKVSCEATCTGQGTDGSTNIQFCDPSADDCPTGTTCQASQVLLGYSVCN